MDNTPVISLCIPTNGVIEWVFPVLDSIFNQGIDSSLYEVVITDNGNNQDFKEKLKENYLNKYSNLVYAETNALPFLNEIEAYKLANGQLIKFVNHRTMLTEGALARLVSFATENAEEKPIIYFANGVLKLEKAQHRYTNFDQFVRNLSYWSSWSTGMTIWKKDFENIPEKTEFNQLFPHTTILFRERNSKSYLIDNTVIMNELPVGKIAKGRYDLFYAFAVEYPGILLNLLMSGDITMETFLSVKEDNLEFLAKLYFDFVLRKIPCSYDLSSFKTSVEVFYSKTMVVSKVIKVVMKKAKEKIASAFRGK